MTEKKIAGISYDDFLTVTPSEPVPKYEEVEKYKNKLIAFLDVLAIKKLIFDNINGKEHIAIKKIRKINKIVDDSTKILNSEDIDYLHISDSFVFVCNPKSIISLIKLLAIIQIRIITECCFLLRGAVTLGDVLISDNGKFIVGPAYIQAYLMQEDNAIYPRIIVCKNTINEINKDKNQFKQLLKQDSDKEYFIDYIKVFMALESVKKQDITIRLGRENIYNHLEHNFKKYYNKEDHKISQKYGWTIQYYKQVGVWKDA